MRFLLSNYTLHMGYMRIFSVDIRTVFLHRKMYNDTKYDIPDTCSKLVLWLAIGATSTRPDMMMKKGWTAICRAINVTRVDPSIVFWRLAFGVAFSTRNLSTNLICADRCYAYAQRLYYNTACVVYVGRAVCFHFTYLRIAPSISRAFTTDTDRP